MHLPGFVWVSVWPPAMGGYRLRSNQRPPEALELFFPADAPDALALADATDSLRLLDALDLAYSRDANDLDVFLPGSITGTPSSRQTTSIPYIPHHSLDSLHPSCCTRADMNEPAGVFFPYPCSLLTHTILGRAKKIRR